jgi:hypothetical protein
LTEIVDDYTGREWPPVRFNSLHLVGKDIGPQLMLSSGFGPLNQFFGGAPQQPRRYSEDDRKERDDRFGVLVNELPQTPEADFAHYQELGGTLLKGLAGFVVIMLAYAGLKRW